MDSIYGENILIKIIIIFSGGPLTFLAWLLYGSTSGSVTVFVRARVCVCRHHFQKVHKSYIRCNIKRFISPIYFLSKQTNMPIISGERVESLSIQIPIIMSEKTENYDSLVCAHKIALTFQAHSHHKHSHTHSVTTIYLTDYPFQRCHWQTRADGPK